MLILVIQIFDLQLGFLRPLLRFKYLDGTVLIFINADELTQVLQFLLLFPLGLGHLTAFRGRHFHSAIFFTVLSLIIWLTLLP